MIVVKPRNKSLPGDELVKMYQSWCRAIPARQKEIVDPSLPYSKVTELTHRIKRLQKGVQWFEYQFGTSYKPSEL